MATYADKLQETLKAHGQSLTKPRLIVFNALQDKEPQTMQQLVDRCKERIDRASVYRTVTLFEKLGITQRLQIGWKYKIELSDAFHRHHHHLSCSQCGRTIAFQADHLLETRLQSIAGSANFEIKSHQIEVQGLCENCQVIDKTA